MIRAFFMCCGWVVKGMMLSMVLFITLCMDVFTIPIFIILWMFCKIFKLRIPHLLNTPAGMVHIDRANGAR